MIATAKELSGVGTSIVSSTFSNIVKSLFGGLTASGGLKILGMLFAIALTAGTTYHFVEVGNAEERGALKAKNDNLAAATKAKEEVRKQYEKRAADLKVVTDKQRADDQQQLELADTYSKYLERELDNLKRIPCWDTKTFRGIRK